MHPFARSQFCIALVALGGALAHAAQQLEMTTPIPSEINTPATVETAIGPLKFPNGFPADDTVKRVYDHLDRQRAIEVFLNLLPAASLAAMRKGLREVGAVDGAIGIWEEPLDPRSLLLTGSSDSVYAMSWLDTGKGPLVIESPPRVSGGVDDFWFRRVGDLGANGPDRGQGGKFLLLPPGYDGAVPSGFFVLRSSTYNNWLIWRAVADGGDAKTEVANIKRHARVYLLSDTGSAPPEKFINLSDRAINTVPANDATFYDELNEVIQAEAPQSFSPDILGMAASIGLKHGQTFAPDARMQKILGEAAAIGNATARAISFAPRDPDAALYPDSHWRRGFLDSSQDWLRDGYRYLDARTGFFYAATVDTPALATAQPGTGSQYAVAMRDDKDQWLDGDRHYRLRLAADVPAKDFWSLAIYDPQTRSLLQTDQRAPGVNGRESKLAKNPDGSLDIYFGPKAAPGKEQNWIQTLPGKGWFAVFRLYGPLQPWLDKSWKLEDIERLD